MGSTSKVLSSIRIITSYPHFVPPSQPCWKEHPHFSRAVKLQTIVYHSAATTAFLYKQHFHSLRVSKSTAYINHYQQPLPWQHPLRSPSNSRHTTLSPPSSPSNPS